MAEGFIVSIAGLPYFATSNPDITTPSFWLPVKTSLYPRGATMLAGALRFTGWSWSEKMRVVDGDLDVSGLTFTLEDVVAGSGTGLASNQHWLTYLTTRDPRDLGSSVLASSCTASGNFTLATPVHSDLTGAMPGVLWLDSEAIDCTSIDAGTGVVTVAGSGRGYYGTRAVAHTRDDELGTRPECWAAPPWSARRRVILWYAYDIPGLGQAALRLWTGYCQRAPRLAADGASFEFQCESAWTVHKNRPVGDPTASCRVRGYNKQAVQIGLELPDSTLPGFNSRWSFWNDTDDLARVYDTFEELISEARERLHSRLLTATPAATSAYVQTEYDGSTLRLSVVANGYTEPIQAAAMVMGELSLGTPVNTMDPKRTQVEVRIPTVGIVLDSAYDLSSSTRVQRVPVDTIAQLPSTFADISTPTAGTTLQPALVGEYDDQKRLVIYGSSGTTPLSRLPDDGVIGGPSVVGLARFVRRDIERFDRPLPLSTGLSYDLGPVRTRGRIMIDRPLQLRLCTIVNTNHWLTGFFSIISDASFSIDGDDFENSDAALAYTQDDLAAREWYLDGSQTLDELITPACATSGCNVITVSGGISVAPLRYPLRHETPDYSFAATDLVDGTRVDWTVLPEGLVNEVTIKTGDVPPLTVRDSRSVQRYERGTKHPEIELAGLPPGDPAARDSRNIATRVLSRIIQLWGDPTAMVRWTTTLENANNVFLGDFVLLSDNTSPNGSGTRGLSSKKVLITGKTWDLGRGTITWEGVIFPESYGYAPAVKIASLATATLTVATGYVGGTGTYAPSGTNSGVDFFTAGDRCKLLRRNVTTYDYLDVIVSSTNPAGGTITLTAAPGGSWPGWISGGWVDLVFNDWGVAGLQTAQKLYMYGGGGNQAEGAIASTSEKSRRWAP